MKTYFICFVGLLAILGSGCSTIVNGKTQTVAINSNVKGAELLLDGKPLGQTPFNGLIPRGSGKTLTVQKEGYESKSIALDTSFEPVFWGNIIIGGVLGSTTDLASGSMYKYTPATINVDLEKTQGN